MKTPFKIFAVCATFVCASAFLGGSSSEASTPAGLVSWWKAEGNTLDAQGANNGTAQGTVNYAPGAVGQAFSLAGNGYIDVASPTFNAYTSGFTVAGWIDITAYSGYASLINFRDSSQNSGFSLEEQATAPGEMDFYVHQGGADYNSISASGWLLNTPYWIAATFDAATGTMDLYRNGNLVASRNDLPHTNMAMVGTPTFQIGRNIVTGDSWNGLIDEAQFYDHALTQPEIASLMVPEPGTISLVLVGFVGLAGIARRRLRNKISEPSMRARAMDDGGPRGGNARL
jgi:hypothetical protein